MKLCIDFWTFVRIGVSDIWKRQESTPQSQFHFLLAYLFKVFTIGQTKWPGNLVWQELYQEDDAIIFLGQNKMSAKRDVCSEQAKNVEKITFATSEGRKKDFCGRHEEGGSANHDLPRAPCPATPTDPPCKVVTSAFLANAQIALLAVRSPT